MRSTRPGGCFAALLCIVFVCPVAGAYEGQRANSVLLNGGWEFARGNGDESAESAAGQKGLNWRAVQIPGPFMEWNERLARELKFVWARRRFDVTPAQANSLAVLRWNYIAHGATAFINGRQVGHNEPIGPYQVIVPPGVLRAGQNETVLKIPGGAGLRKSRSGNLLIPSGFGAGMPQIGDDIWIDFAGAAYVKWALAMPDLANSRVRIRITPTGLDALDDLKIVARVEPWPDGRVIGEGAAPAKLIPVADPLGGEHFYVDVPTPGFKPWTYEQCPLYTAHVKLTKDGRTLDELTFRFGMRQIGVAARNYKLNGRNLWLRGSNLVAEWNWGDMFRGKEKEYLVTEAREMSMNSFRTHTQPPPRPWADVCDEHGTMILAEFPVLYNYQDYKFTPEEYEVWHRNVLTDAAGWMARLWNHPSVIMWVLSNESRDDDAWEEGPFQHFVNGLDPTRPTLRTGTTGTKENYDVHTCGNIINTEEGHLQPQIRDWFKTAGERTLTNTEYMNIFDRSKRQWAGTDDSEADALAVAQIGMEHTEAMRRARLDGIWPYMYAGWTRTRMARRGRAVWKANYASPLSAVWHSSLSPVLASLDLFDANYVTGQQVTTDLYLINDSWHDAAVHVDLLLTGEDAQFIPEADCFEKPVSRWSFDFALKADSLEKTPVTWKLPEQEGNYWLTARLTGVAGRPVLSQRFVRAIRPPVVSESARKQTFVVLGGDDAARSFFETRGLRASRSLEGLWPESHAVVIWDPARLSDDEKRNAKALCDFATAGGRIVVMSTSSWNWPELCDVTIGKGERCSRAFPYPGVDHPTMAGIDPQWLARWNGLPGTVASRRLDGPAMARSKKILWARDLDGAVAASVPAAQGTGSILFTQLDLRRHVDKSKANYDPAAERILLNLLGVGVLQSRPK
jgi:hypothetical protein